LTPALTEATRGKVKNLSRGAHHSGQNNAVHAETPASAMHVGTEKSTSSPVALQEPTTARRPALKVPVLPAWDNRQGEDNVNIFLPRLAQYLEIQGVNRKERPNNVFPFLKGKAFQLWELESKYQ
jgi:hypothetical protein